MITPQLVEYVKAQKQKGLSQSQIEESLVLAGWPPEMAKNAVEQVFHIAHNLFVAPQNIAKPVEPAKIRTPRSKKIKAILASIVIVGLIVFGGGGVYAYRYYLQPPSLVAQKMFQRVTEVKSFTYDLDWLNRTSVSISYPDSSNLDLSQSLSNQIDPKKKTKEIKNNVKVKILSGYDYLNAKEPKTYLKVDTTGTVYNKTKIDAALETESIGQIVYARINKLPDLKNYLGDKDFNFLVSQWIKFDLTKLMKEYGGNASSGTNSAELTAAQLKQLEKVIKKTKIFEMKEKMPSETVNGQSTFHYKFAINKDGVKKILTELNKLSDTSNPYVNNYVDYYDSMLSEFNMPNGEIWIGKKDYYPYRLKFTSAVEDLIPKDRNTEDYKITGNMSFTVNISNFNKPIDILAPKDSKDIKEIIDQVSKTIYGKDETVNESADGTVDLSVDTDGDELSNTEEAVYGTDANNPDTDGDGYQDGQEVENGYNPNGPGKLENTSSNSSSTDSTDTQIEVPADNTLEI